MQMRWILKTLTLFFALCLTTLSIYWLNSSHRPDFFSSLGFNTSMQTFNWCSERVLRLESLSEKPWSLYEENQRWMVLRANAPPAEMDYLSVEKWFAKYCTVKISELKSEKIFDLPLEHFAKVFFNNKGTATIHIRGPNTYQVNQTVFESQEMTEALTAFRALLAITP